MNRTLIEEVEVEIRDRNREKIVKWLARWKRNIDKQVAQVEEDQLRYSSAMVKCEAVLEKGGDVDKVMREFRFHNNEGGY